MLQEKSFRQTVKLKDAYAEVFCFANNTEAREYHIAVHVTNTELNFKQQLEIIAVR